MRKQSILAAHCFFWTLLCLLNVAMAPLRASNHEFWCFYFLPVPCIAMAVAARILAQKIHPVASFVLALALSASLWSPTIKKLESERFFEKKSMIVDLNGVLNENDFLVVADYQAPWMFYASVWVRAGVTSTSGFEECLEAWDDGSLTCNRMVFLIPRVLLKNFEGLEDSMRRHKMDVMPLGVHDAWTLVR